MSVIFVSVHPFIPHRFPLSAIQSPTPTKETMPNQSSFSGIISFHFHLRFKKRYSGSYVMGFVLADTQGWLPSAPSPPQPEPAGPFSAHPFHTFANLRSAVNNREADFFLWEHFTSKRYYDSHSIKRIGEIFTPWSSWMIVARDGIMAMEAKENKTNDADGDDDENDQRSRLSAMFESLNQGIRYFEEHAEEAIQYISTCLDYSVEDARDWLGTVRFARDVRGVRAQTIVETAGVLVKAGLIVDEGNRDDGQGPKVSDMIGIAR